MSVRVRTGDAQDILTALPGGGVRCCVTSPPYFGLRDYGCEGQIGLERTLDEYVSRLVEVFREVRRVLTDDGTLWLNLGDTYAADRGGTNMPAETLAGGVNGRGDENSYRGRPGGPSDKSLTRHSARMASRDAPAIGLKHKDLIGVPWRVALALQADGWYLRSDIIWHKPNPMPESVLDRPTKAHEYLFLLSKSERYFYDAEAIKEAAVSSRKRGPALHPDKVSTNGNSGLSRREPTKTRNARTVWTIPTRPFKGAHFAVFPEALAERCILAGSAVGDTVLDPFGGSGTVGVVAQKHNRSAVLCELNPAYVRIAKKRMGLPLLDLSFLDE